MEIAIEELAKSIVALFIIVDPIGNVPIFMGLTSNMSREERRKTFETAIIISFVLLNIFALAGQSILSIFNISIHSFKIAGGLLLLIISMKILLHGMWEEKYLSSRSIGVVPIAFPLLVGPGAITLTIVNIQTAGVLVTVISVIVVLLITWLILRAIEPINSFLGETGSVVISRLMAVFIAAIAIEFIASGIRFML
ncbi:MAG: MarC family protein [Thaumarchaeota archaeon]|jgi:multiple antibiotic resistance protein|nr:MarC family protein [Candidatus Terraquivivens yellowstonensis]